MKKGQPRATPIKQKGSNTTKMPTTSTQLRAPTEFAGTKSIHANFQIRSLRSMKTGKGTLVSSRPFT